MKTIERLKEIDGPGQYRKDVISPIITIDEELSDDDRPLYAVCIGDMWLMNGYKLKTFRSIGGIVRHLHQLAVDGVGKMGFWIDSRASGQNISGSYYKKSQL